MAERDQTWIKTSGGWQVLIERPPELCSPLSQWGAYKFCPGIGDYNAAMLQANAAAQAKALTAGPAYHCLGADMTPFWR